MKRFAVIIFCACFLHTSLGIPYNHPKTDHVSYPNQEKYEARLITFPKQEKSEHPYLSDEVTDISESFPNSSHGNDQQLEVGYNEDSKKGSYMNKKVPEEIVPIDDPVQEYIETDYHTSNDNEFFNDKNFNEDSENEIGYELPNKGYRDPQSYQPEHSEPNDNHFVKGPEIELDPQPYVPEALKPNVNSEIDNPQTTHSFGSKFSSWVDKLHEYKPAISRAYKEAKYFLHKTSDDVWKSIKQHYENIPQRINELKEWFTKSTSDLGLMVQKGASYVAERCTIIFNNAEASDILHRLEGKLKEGDENVNRFFDIIGEKLSQWSATVEKHDTEIDDGLNNYHPTKHYNKNFGDPKYPHLFREKEIQDELSKLVNNQIIQLEEANLLSGIKQVY